MPGLRIFDIAKKAKKTHTYWLVVGVQKTPFGPAYVFIDSKAVPKDENLHLVSVTTDDMGRFDYVVIATAEEVSKRGWFTKGVFNQ